MSNLAATISSFDFVFYSEGDMFHRTGRPQEPLASSRLFFAEGELGWNMLLH